MRYWPFILAVVFLGLGIYFYPKPVVTPPPPKVTPQPPPVVQPTPPPPKQKPSVTLDRSREYTDKTLFQWIIFLPAESGWVNVGQRSIGERDTGSLTPRTNVLWFQTEDWIETYVIKVGTRILTPSSNIFYFGAEHGDCFPVYIKNISNHDINVRMWMSNYPSQFSPPECK